MASSLLIQNARILDPSQQLDQVGDLWVENGVIRAIEPSGHISTSNTQAQIDARGQWLLPGLMDVHVHLREPGQEHKETMETGARAAVAGGFSSVACMPNTKPVLDSGERIAWVRERAKETAVCRVFPIGAISKASQGMDLADIEAMVKEGARALSDDGRPVMNTQLMQKAMEMAKSFGIPVIDHAEDAGAPGSAEGEARLTLRDIELCRQTRCHLHLAHVSTHLALSYIRQAKEEGLPVTAEVSPHHLFLIQEDAPAGNTNFKMSPPLRSDEDRQALRQALQDGTIDMIATDHAPHALSEKNLEYSQAANGVIGLQSALPLGLRLVAEGGVTLARLVESMTVAPARLLGLPLGTLRVGQSADMTLIRPDQEWKFSEADILSKSRNSPFLGWSFKGKVTITMVAGKIVFTQEGAF